MTRSPAFVVVTSIDHEFVKFRAFEFDFDEGQSRFTS